MDARLDTLSTKLYQVNVHLGRIAQLQATIGGFTLEASTPPPLVAYDSGAEDDDDGDDDDASDDDNNRDASFYFTLLPFVTCDKKGKQFWI